jgi:DNA-binding transcriptional regulator GbsR (MarR family)
MSLEEIKKQFITFMEEMYDRLLYPKRFFGCLMAVLVEQKPLTQNRIKELTGYSRTTISQTLDLIHANVPLTQFKKPGERKKYYSLDMSVKEFMPLFFKTIIESYQNKVNFILPIIKDIKPYAKEHPRFYNFKEFLDKFYESSNLYYKIFSKTMENLENMIKTGTIKTSSLPDFNLFTSIENLKRIEFLLSPPELEKNSLEPSSMDEVLSKRYIRFKKRFYNEFRKNLTLANSQEEIARTIIGTELLLEKRPLTQEEIELVTNLPRSTISTSLNQLLDWNMVRMIKKAGDRKNYYIAFQSWDTRVLNRFKVNIKYVIKIQEKISNLIEKVEKMTQSDEENLILNFLRETHYAYLQLELHYKILETKYLSNRINKK